MFDPASLRKTHELTSCRLCHLGSVSCDRGSPCSTCASKGLECTYEKIMVDGRGMHLKDDGRTTRHGKVVIPHAAILPAAAPQTPGKSPPASADTPPLTAVLTSSPTPDATTVAELPIAPLHLWRPASFFTQDPSSFGPSNVSGTPFPWTSNAEERDPKTWRDFAPKLSVQEESEDDDMVDDNDEDDEESDDDNAEKQVQNSKISRLEH